MKNPKIVACVAAALAATALAPNRADACGGTFCDGVVPGPMPVDQTGESVIFVMGGDKAEVHIQISYDPDTNANQFAWLIPLTSVPEFAVGSQPLFDQVLAATVPTFDITTSSEQCDEAGTGSFPATSDASASISESAGGTTGSNDTADEPMVLLQQTVGAFDVTVLQGGTVDSIQTWLETNNYNWDPNAAPILQQYLDEDNVIAALKLTNSAGVEDIHPISLTYDSNETCFPLRLTRIAAVDDMEIRVFVLANDRAAPTNYRHVLVNPLKLDWINYANNYKDVITKAVDANMADGRAFVTEFGGSSDAVVQDGIYSGAWDAQAFVGLDPTLVVDKLTAQGLAACNSEIDCTWGHPLVYGLLLEFLPPPDGTPPAQFYSDLGSFAGDIDAMKWNGGAEFSAAMLERIVEPGAYAVDLLTAWPYLTRMYTTISPNEMMEDPIFHLNPDLEDIPQLRTAENLLLCGGDGVVTLPDGREVYVPGGFSWPDIPGEEWWEEEVQTIALKGAPMTLVNNTAAINKVLGEWNLAHGWPRSPSDTTGGDVPTTGGDNDVTGGNVSGTSSGAATETAEPPLADEPGACACRSHGAGGAWLMLGLLALRRRRR